jgi:hypothetical protein
MPSLRLSSFFRAYTPPADYPRLAWVVLCLVLTLVAVWPIPNANLPFHRNFILYPAFLIMLYLPLRHVSLRQGLCAALPSHLLWLLGLLTAWILLVGLWHADSKIEILQQFNGKWVRVLQTGFMGLVLGRVLLGQQQYRDKAVTLFWWIMCALWLLPLVQMLDMLHVWSQQDYFPWQFSRLTDTRTQLSIALGMLLSFFCAEIGARLALGRRWLPVPWRTLLLMLAVTLFSQLAIATRNGTIGVAGTVLSITVLLLILRAKSWRRRTMAAVVLLSVLLLSALAWISWESDARWHDFKQTLPLALDTQHNLGWLDKDTYPYPKMSNGQQVDVSAYERIAWIKVGVWLIGQEPWGQGIRGDNYHRLVSKYFGKTTTTQSHSGMVNFTLALGIPGMILWLAILSQLVLIGGRSFYLEGKIPGLFLMIFVIGVTVRSMLDNVWADHIMEQFFFFCAFFLALCHQTPAYESGRLVESCGQKRAELGDTSAV